MQMKIRTRALPANWQPTPSSLPNRAQALLAARGVAGVDDLGFQGLADWRLLKGIQGAVELLIKALTQQSHLLIAGDYDADGATGVALAVDMLSRFGMKQVSYLVPNRLTQGYGLTPELVEDALKLKPDLIMTVDNGIASISGVAMAAAHDIPVLVTDHHLPGEDLPAAAAIVNPNQSGCDFPSKNLAGVGVVFYLCIALRAKLREVGWFDTRPEPNLAQGLDLVALGTIADVVPLDNNNRRLIQQGLKRMRAGHARPGMIALAEVAKVSLEIITSGDLAFRLAPRLNAAGRLQDMRQGISCLLAKTPEEAGVLAKALDECNRQRRSKETKMQNQAHQVLRQVAGQADRLPSGVCLKDKSWHIGLIGLVAARLRDRWHRPVLALAPTPVDGDDLWRGSARSVEGIHIRDVLVDMNTRHPGLMDSFGGHAMAAGLSVRGEQLPVLTKAFSVAVERVATEELLSPEIVTDGELETDDFTIELASSLAQISPWGKDFPAPMFHGEFEVGEASLLNGNVLKLRVQPVRGASLWLEAIAFNIQATDWYERVRRIRLVYELNINHYRGMSFLQLIVRHWEKLG